MKSIVLTHCIGSRLEIVSTCLASLGDFETVQEKIADVFNTERVEAYPHLGDGWYIDARNHTFHFKALPDDTWNLSPDCEPCFTKGVFCRCLKK